MTTMKEAVAAVEIFPAAARTANATSGGIDTWNLHGRARALALLVSAGAASGTTPTLDVRIQHADNDVAGEYVDVPNGAIPQLTAAGFAEVDVRNFRRFVRVVAAVGGTTPSFTFAAVILFGEPLNAPI